MDNWLAGRFCSLVIKQQKEWSLFQAFQWNSIIGLKRQNNPVRETAKTLVVISNLPHSYKACMHQPTHQQQKARKTTKSNENWIISMVKKNSLKTSNKVKNTWWGVGWIYQSKRHLQEALFHTLDSKDRKHLKELAQL